MRKSPILDRSTTILQKGGDGAGGGAIQDAQQLLADVREMVAAANAA